MQNPIDTLINYISDKISDRKLENNDIKIDNIKEQLDELKKVNTLLDEKEREIQEHYNIIEEENEILSSIVKGECLYNVMKKIVYVIEKFTNSSMGSVLIKNNDLLWDYCSPNLPKDYLDELSNGVPIGPDSGTCGAAAFYKEPYFIEDISKHKNWLGYPSILKKAKNFGCVSCHSSPILDDKNEVLGTVAIYCTSNTIHKNMHERLLNWSTRVASIAIQKDRTKNKIIKYTKEVEKKNKLLETVIECSGGYLWFKNADGKYVFCDNNFKEGFFKLPPTQSASGYDDIELINMYRKTGKRHDFGELCVSTDVHSREKGHICKYIEGGYVDDVLFILEIIKNPLFENNEYKGNIGFAINRSSEFDLIKKEIEQLYMINKIEPLTESNYDKSPFVYYIKNGVYKNECFTDNK